MRARNLLFLWRTSRLGWSLVAVWILAVIAFATVGHDQRIESDRATSQGSYDSLAIRQVAFQQSASGQSNPLRAAKQDIENSSDNDFFTKRTRPFLKKYCLDCHSGEDAENGVDLAIFLSQSDVANELETWSNVLKQLEHNSMPPADSDQPRAREVKDLKSYILESIGESKHQHAPLGKLRRLNRVEYENTIRDLFRLSRDCFNNPSRIVQTTDYFQPSSGRMPRYVLAVSYFFNSHRRHSDLPGVSTLPVDPPVEHGFANDQDALSFSPLQLENYMEIATAMLNNSEFELISGVWNTMFVGEPGATQTELIQQGHDQLELFLSRAFRRPATAAEIDRYQKLFDVEFAGSSSYIDAMKTTVSGILVSPKFLFRQEFLPADSTNLNAREKKLNQNFALANRLSYFLWSSMPDDELFQAARERRLTDARYLELQVERMMDDPKCKALSTNFGMQWLKVQKAASAQPDKTKFPEYYDVELPPPAVSMMIEQLLFFESIMIENRSIEEFIKSDFAFLNRQLMDWYQVDPKIALGYTPEMENFEDFFRVKWPTGHRGGVISSGAMLISTSTTTRTSPVYRGAWVLDVIFDSPPPPAPANIPPLEPAGGDHLAKLNVREKLKHHRENAACASCHDRIDPMGFALEMFDSVGRWRGKYETGEPVDCSGSINGEPYRGSAVFKNVILRDKTRFVRAFVQHTMKYALGRQLHFTDEPEIRQLTEDVINQNCKFQAVIKSVVLSKMFRRFDEE